MVFLRLEFDYRGNSYLGTHTDRRMSHRRVCLPLHLLYDMKVATLALSGNSIDFRDMNAESFLRSVGPSFVNRKALRFFKLALNLVR